MVMVIMYLDLKECKSEYPFSLTSYSKICETMGCYYSNNSVCYNTKWKGS